MKIALLISGQLRQFWYCADSILNNLIIPNDLDVFIMTGTNNVKSKYILDDNKTGSMLFSRYHKDIKNIPIKMNEYDFCCNKFGKHMKKFNKNNYIKNYNNNIFNILKQNITKSKEINKNILNTNKYKQPYIENIFQYMLINQGIEMIEQYELENDIKYDYIFKIRPDMDIISKVNLNSIISNYDIYVPPEGKTIYYGDNGFYFYHEYMFLFKSEHNDYIKQFPYNYCLLYDDYELNNKKPISHIVERQFYIYLSKLKVGSLNSKIQLKMTNTTRGNIYIYKLLY